MNTLTIDEVKAIYFAEEKVTGVSGFDPMQSTRTLVHAELLRRNPMPCTDLTPAMRAARDRREPLTYREKEEQMAHQRGQVAEDQHVAHQRARDAKHPSVVDADGKIIVADALHHVQALHSTSLWEETEQLVSKAVAS